MPLLHSGHFHCLSPSFLHFGLPRFVWFLLQSFLTTFSLRYASVARLIVYLPVAVNLFHGSQFSWIRICLTKFLLCHSTFLQAAADFLLDPLYPRVLSLLFWRRSAARLQTLRRFL
jgi:hypothetical protein